MSFPTGDETLTQILVRNSLTKYSSFNFWCFTCLELKLFTPLLIGDRKISFSLGSIFILLISLCKEIKILLKPFSALIWKDTKKQWQYFSHSFTDSFNQNIIPLFLYISLSLPPRITSPFQLQYGQFNRWASFLINCLPVHTLRAGRQQNSLYWCNKTQIVLIATPFTKYIDAALSLFNFPSFPLQSPCFNHLITSQAWSEHLSEHFWVVLPCNQSAFCFLFLERQ